MTQVSHRLLALLSQLLHLLDLAFLLLGALLLLLSLHLLGVCLLLTRLAPAQEYETLIIVVVHGSSCGMMLLLLYSRTQVAGESAAPPLAAVLTVTHLSVA